MEFHVKHAPVFSTLELSLAEGEFVVAQPNSLLTMSVGVGISAHVGRQEYSVNDADSQTPQTRKSGSWFGGLKSMLGGESFFTAEFRAKTDQQTVVLAPESYGDIVVLQLAPECGYYLTRGSYLANIGETNVQVKYGGVKGLMSRKGLFLMHVTGVGHVFCQSYGAIEQRYLEAEESVYVDNRYMIAFSDTVTYRLVKATESLKDSLLSGEGLVNRYTGPGSLFFQTRGKPSGGFLSTILQAAF
jgi:uncharacterized protein (TIGR00266 family)